VTNQQPPFDASNNDGLEITADSTQCAFTNSHPTSRQYNKYNESKYLENIYTKTFGKDSHRKK
jgi:hypothetical protein